MTDIPDHAADSEPERGGLVSVRSGLAPRTNPYEVGPSLDGASGAAEEFNSNFREYWRIIQKRKKVFLAVVMAAIVLGLVVTLSMTRRYTAVVRLQVDRSPMKVVEGGSTIPMEGPEFEFLKTQFELLQGRAIAERVASALKISDDPDFLERKGFSPLSFLKGLFRSRSGAGATTDSDVVRDVVDVIDSNRSIKPVPGSRLVDVSYTDRNPARAQKIAQGLGEAFIAANLDKRFQANAYAKQFLEDQLKQLMLRLQDSEKSLLDFGQKEQIVASSEKTSIAENNLAAANAALGALVAERIKNEQLFKQVEQSKGLNLPQFLTNPVIEGLRDKRNALVTEFQEKRETFKPTYPEMVRITNKIAEIDRELNAEINTIKNSYKGQYQSSLAQESEMKTRIESLRAEFLDLQKRSIQYNIIKREVDSNRVLYESLLQRYKEVDIAGGVGANNVFIVERAELPRSPSSPNMTRNLLISTLLGGIAGLIAVFGLERLDDTISSTEELERLTNLATLGVIPQIGREFSVEAELQDMRSGLCEAYRTTCTSLHFATESGLPKSILITSASPSEGKSTTAVAIARHFATVGLKVLIIDGDMRKPSLHVKLGLDNVIGLSNYLTGGCKPPAAMQKTSTTNLVFMSSGPVPPNPAELLASSRLSSLLTLGEGIFDLVIIDGPPVMGLADTQLLSNSASSTVFVVRAGQARKVQVRDALKRMKFARAHIVGAVLTGQDMRTANYGYGYGYGDGYGYGYGAENHRPEAISDKGPPSGLTAA